MKTPKLKPLKKPYYPMDGRIRGRSWYLVKHGSHWHVGRFISSNDVTDGNQDDEVERWLLDDNVDYLELCDMSAIFVIARDK